MGTRNYLDADLKRLFGLAAGRCSIKTCRRPLIDWSERPDDPIVLGQIGHIVASSDNGPRADPSMPEKERNKYANLVLVCGDHHKVVDTLDSKYTVSELKTYKVVHERWVEECLSRGMDNFTSAELEVACRAIEGSSVLPSTALHAIPPSRKLLHNSLFASSERLITFGLMRSDAVRRYLQVMASQIDPDFPGRLRAGFVAEYGTFWERGLRGDALFLGMKEFAGGGTDSSFERQAAGLAVLSYLFQVCDVFEEPPDDPP